MNTIQLGRLTRPEFLKQVGRELLGKLFGKYAVELAARGFAPPAETPGDDEYFAALARVLGSTEPLPDKLLEALAAIELVATADGRATVRALCVAEGRMVAVVSCDPWNCNWLPVTAVDWLACRCHRTRVARAVCRPFALELGELTPGVGWTEVVARFAAAARDEPVGTIAATVPTGAAVKAGRNILRKVADGWLLVFQGAKRLLPDYKALHFVSTLMINPSGEAIHASELASKAVGDAVIEGERNLAADDQLTYEAMKQSRREYLLVLEDASATELEQAEAGEQLAALAAWSKQWQRGTEGRVQKQARAIRAVIRRLVRWLERAVGSDGLPDGVLRGFGEHLVICLCAPSFGGRGGSRFRRFSGMAGKFIYVPTAGVVWMG